MNMKQKIEDFKKELNAMTDEEFIEFSRELGIELSDRKKGEPLFQYEEIYCTCCGDEILNENEIYNICNKCFMARIE